LISVTADCRQRHRHILAVTTAGISGAQHLTAEMVLQTGFCQSIIVAMCNLKSRLAGRLLSEMLGLFFNY
jgi:hypothetical protein